MKKMFNYADIFIGGLIRAVIVFYLVRFLFADYPDWNNAAPLLFVVTLFLYTFYSVISDSKK